MPTSKNPLDDLSPAAQQRRQKTRQRMEKAGAFLLAPGLVKKKKKDTSIPLAFEEEADGGADEMVATAELEPWARIGTLRIACQVLEKDGDDLSWQFELADLWFR